MQAGMHEMAVNVIVHYIKASASVVFLCLFIMVSILYQLCGVFITHLLRKARGCCMHVFSSLKMIQLVIRQRNFVDKTFYET